MPSLERQPLSAGDQTFLNEKKEKGYFTLIKFYGTLFVGLIWIYFKMVPGGTYHGHTMEYGKMTPDDYRHVYYCAAIFFGGIFLYFLIRDYRRMILPFKKELAKNLKNCFSFTARKYRDPIYKNCLLYYPRQADIYVRISEEDFNSIVDGSDMYMETGSLTGEVLLLKCGEKVISSAEEFSFSELTVRPELDDMLD